MLLERLVSGLVVFAVAKIIAVVVADREVALLPARVDDFLETGVQLFGHVGLFLFHVVRLHVVTSEEEEVGLPGFGIFKGPGQPVVALAAVVAAQVHVGQKGKRELVLLRGFFLRSFRFRLRTAADERQREQETGEL